MKTRRDVRFAAGKVGPGGLRCWCCGRSGLYNVRKVLRNARKELDRLAISEGLAALVEEEDEGK